MHILGPLYSAHSNMKHTIEYQRCLFVLWQRHSKKKKTLKCISQEDAEKNLRTTTTRDSMFFFNDNIFLLLK